MRLRAALDRLLGRGADAARPIRVRLLLKGRTAKGWYDVDRSVALPAGATLGDLIAEADRLRVPLREALASSPHLAHTLMLNGERCPVDQNRDRALADGDEVYLLAPFAGG